MMTRRFLRRTQILGGICESCKFIERCIGILLRKTR